jgi:hypothetical protein
MVAPFTPPKGNNLAKAAMIELRKAQAAAAEAQLKAEAFKNKGFETSSTVKAEDAALARAKSFISPSEAPDRLRIIFDNSGSMDGPKLDAAKQGVVEFLKNCTPNATAVAVHLLNPKGAYDYKENCALSLPKNIESATLTSDIILLASEITEPSVEATGGTPLYQVIEAALRAEPKATRLIAFSDGSPEQTSKKDQILRTAKEMGIPIDTVFIADKDESSYYHIGPISEMKHIAEMTGGIFLDLTRGSIKSGLKYLAPSKRLMLSDSSFKGKVERGEI